MKTEATTTLFALLRLVNIINVFIFIGNFIARLYKEGKL